MHIIVGLGNPGKEYEHSRHNVGFMVADRLKKLGLPNSKCVLVKPKIYMNRSGEAVKKIFEENLNSDLANLWVIHDDLDLPLGTIRIKLGGSSGGHNGVQSIIDILRTDRFWRFRVGIGRPLDSDSSTSTLEVEEYVLSPFSPDEKHLVDQVIRRATHKVLSNLEKKSIINETLRVG